MNDLLEGASMKKATEPMGLAALRMKWVPVTP